MYFRSTVLASLVLLLTHNVSHAEEEKNKDCIEPTGKNDSLGEMRDQTHSSLCKAVKSIDSWFGKDHEFDGEVFSGKVILGFRQDEETGFDPKLRIRIRAQLPNVSKRFNAFIGRTDEDAFITDSRVTGIDGLSNDLKDEDASWLIGLGYRNPNRQGFDTSIGAKISSGIQPYAKLRYRYHLKTAENQSARATQTLFWKNDDGIGTTTNLQYGYKFNKKRLVSLGFGATYRKDTEIWDTGSSITLYNKLSNNRGLALKAYVYGESGDKSQVNVPEYGISLSYRQPFLRPWLVLKTSIENRWAHEREIDPRESYAKLGMQLEMSFGKQQEKL
jgi:hypothetical protein